MSTATTTTEQPIRCYPTLEKTDEGKYEARCPGEFEIKHLLGMKTHDAANGVYLSAISALGKSGEKYASMFSAMFAELEPRDGVEAMLISQMTVTHVAMTTLCERMTYQSSSKVAESHERSVTRLSRTFLAQMDALKKYRAKAQQTVRVERVNVEKGGQAIVGDVTHGGRVQDEK